MPTRRSLTAVLRLARSAGAGLAITAALLTVFGPARWLTLDLLGLAAGGSLMAGADIALHRNRDNRDEKNGSSR